MIAFSLFISSLEVFSNLCKLDFGQPSRQYIHTTAYIPVALSSECNVGTFICRLVMTDSVDERDIHGGRRAGGVF